MPLQRSTKSTQKVRVRPEACIKCRESKLKCIMDKSSGTCSRCAQFEIVCSGPQPTTQRMAKRLAKANNLHTHCNRDTSPTSASSSSTVPPSPSDTQDSVCSDFSELLSSEQRYTDFLNYVSPMPSGSASSMVPYADYAPSTQAIAATRFDFVNTNLDATLDANLLSPSPSLTRRHSYPNDHFASTIWTSSDNFLHWEPTYANTCQPSDLSLGLPTQQLGAAQVYTTSNDFLFSPYVQF